MDRQRLNGVAVPTTMAPLVGRSSSNGDIRRRYKEIELAGEYQHFIRIPGRIIRCIDYLEIEYERTLVHERLSAYYLFVGVVDEALDRSDINVGERILQHFERPISPVDEFLKLSTVAFATEVFKGYVDNENRHLIALKLTELYSEVVSERAARSISDYIQHRKIVGVRTAEISYLLIHDLLTGDTDSLLRLMRQVGKVGCLIDSVIDLELDWRSGLLSFKPSALDRVKLISCTVREGALTLLRYPRLTDVFTEAIVDNIRDRFRAGNTELPPRTDQKDEPIRAT